MWVRRWVGAGGMKCGVAECRKKRRNCRKSFLRTSSLFFFFQQASYIVSRLLFGIAYVRARDGQSIDVELNRAQRNYVGFTNGF